MEIGVLKESKQQEKRVAITPKIVSKIKKLGHTVRVETVSYTHLTLPTNGCV